MDGSRARLTAMLASATTSPGSARKRAACSTSVKAMKHAQLAGRLAHQAARWATHP